MMNDEQKRNEEKEDLYSAFDNPVRPEDKAPKKRRISSRTRTLVIALVAVVVLVGVLLLIPLLPEENAGSSTGSSVGGTDTVTHTLLDKSVKDEDAVVVYSVSVDGEKDFTVYYDKDEKAYYLKDYEDLALDSYNISTLMDCATTFTAQDKLDTVDDLKDYGLDKPKATVTIAYHDGEKATVKVGNRTPDESGYYVTLDGKQVYISNESMVSPFLMSDTQYVSTSLLTTPTADKDDQDGKAVLKELELTGSAFDKPLAIRRISPTDTAEFTYFSYVITSPYYRGVSEAASSEFGGFTALTAAQAVVLHPTRKQLADFGFDKPGVVAKVKVAIETSKDTSDDSEAVSTAYYNTVSITLTVGSTDESGNYFITVDGVDAIFYVASNQLSAIVERRYENTISDQLFLKDITTLSGLSLAYEGKAYDYAFTHHPKEEERDDMLVVKVDGKQYPTADFRLLYQLAMGIERYGSTDTAPTGDSLLTITLRDEEGSQYLKVDFYPNTGSLCTARTSEGELFTVKASEVNDFIKQAGNYMSGKQVLINY